MSGYDIGYVLRNGSVVSARSDDEVLAWQRRHPNPVLIATPVLGVEVITSFTGWLSGRLGETPYCSPLQVVVESQPLYGALGSETWEGALRNHEEMVTTVIQRWFCTASTTPVLPGPMRGPTKITDVAKMNGCFLPSQVGASSAAQSPPGLHSLRRRLLNGLDEMGSADWLEINRALRTTPMKCLSAVSSAWEQGLLVRTDSGDPWAPPTFALSGEGSDRVQCGDFSVTPSTVDNQWEAGWQAWMAHSCPVCGGFLGYSGAGNLVCVLDASQRGKPYRDFHYRGILREGTLVEATAKQGDLEYFVSYVENRREKRKRGEVLYRGSGLPSDAEVRSYVRSAFA